MTHGQRDDDVVALPVGVQFFAYPEDVCEVLGNTGFLSNDNDGHIVEPQRRPYLNPPSTSVRLVCVHEMFHFMDPKHPI
jgi:hypothetical protein